jgi:signal transduction histidine kinase
MSPNPKTESPEGQVVYRRMAVDEPDGNAVVKEPRLDPGLAPLIAGFALLLLLIMVLGNLSVRRVEETSNQALDQEHTLAARSSLLLQFRVALTRLDNEARDRMESKARHELKPPFDLRLDTFRGNVNDLIARLDTLPLAQLPKWQTFRNDVAVYVNFTKDSDQFSQYGFDKFRDVDAELEEITKDTSAEQDRIFDRNSAAQKSATRTIRTWNVLALLAGLVVAAATIWQVQRRFRQTRQSTEAARREREFSNQMLEGMVSALAAIDRQDRIRSANTAFLRMFPQLSIGASIHDKIGSPERTKLLEAATASHVEAATYRGRWDLNSDSAARTFDVYSSPLEIEGEFGQILTLVDVTEATKAEAALRRSEALAAVGSAAAQLAHEIKNPLGSIRLGVEMLREHAVSADATKTIGLVERGIDHLNKLVVDVTQFSRRRKLETFEVDLHELIDSSIDLIADRIQEKQTPITKNYAGGDIQGVWDPEQLREVFVNLLANAVDASEPKAPVEISTERFNGRAAPKTREVIATPATLARITICDHGSGMDAKTQARLFEPFFTTKKRGTGLGLSIVRQIIDLHGGNIEVESQTGKGTTFRIELPLETT